MISILSRTCNLKMLPHLKCFNLMDYSEERCLWGNFWKKKIMKIWTLFFLNKSLVDFYYKHLFSEYTLGTIKSLPRRQKSRLCCGHLINNFCAVLIRHRRLWIGGCSSSVKEKEEERREKIASSLNMTKLTKSPQFCKDRWEKILKCASYPFWAIGCRRRDIHETASKCHQERYNKWLHMEIVISEESKIWY